MKKISKTVVFFGSGPVAAESLRLLAKQHTIEAIITKPRAAHHRGDVPVLDLGRSLGLPTYTATDKRSLDELFSTVSFESKLGILIDFGIIVSQKVIDYFPLGIINSHFSLLPEWRGADPITFSILSGQTRTGVSLMLLTAGMDEGPLLAQSDYNIVNTMTTPQLTEELIILSDGMLSNIIPLYFAGSIDPIDQTVCSISDVREPTYSRKLKKLDGVLDWHKPAAILEREIRAYAGWPKSRTIFGDCDVIITSASIVDAAGQPGKTSVIDKKPVVFCASQALVLSGVKPAGKKEMTGEAFLAGYKSIFLAD